MSSAAAPTSVSLNSPSGLSVNSTSVLNTTTDSPILNGSTSASPPPPLSSPPPPSNSANPNISLIASSAAPPPNTTSSSPPPSPPPPSPSSTATSPPASPPPSPPPSSTSSPPPSPPPLDTPTPSKVSPPPAPPANSDSPPPTPSPPPAPLPNPSDDSTPTPPQQSQPQFAPPPPIDQIAAPPPADASAADPVPVASPPPPTSSTRGDSPPLIGTASPPQPLAPLATGTPPSTSNQTSTFESGDGNSTSSKSESTSPSKTSPSPSTGSSSSSGSTATIVGATIAGVFVIALVALVFIVARRKKRKVGTFPPHSQFAPPNNFSVQSDGYHYGQTSRMMGTPGQSGPFYASQAQNPFTGNSYGSQKGGNMHHGGGPESSVIAGTKTFSYEELMEITNGFSSQNIIGEGGFGCVYKGSLQDGKTVAVKQLKAGSGQGDREFRAEVAIISRVHHRHLVSLVGYSIAENQRLLIYEFVPNKTLEHHLHGKGLPVLDWSKRIKIALGSAKGLAYLHEDCHPKIIHRDIKSANILLDDAFEAQVADFGLAKLTNDSNTHVSTRVMGTFGYLAPEYASSGKLTDRSDVFSFGVVLLELITGRKPVDPTQPLGEESLVEWARPILIRALETHDISELVDPRLDKCYMEAEMFRMIEAAAACIRHSALKRPRMVQVVRALDTEGDLSDLTNGVKVGQSTVYDSGQYNDDIMQFRRMALGSGGSSEYGLYSDDYSSREASGTQKNSWNFRDSSSDFTSGESETRAFRPQNSEKRSSGAKENYGAHRFS